LTSDFPGNPHLNHRSAQGQAKMDSYRSQENHFVISVFFDSDPESVFIILVPNDFFPELILVISAIADLISKMVSIITAVSG
jgi:hypothetical protein